MNRAALMRTVLNLTTPQESYEVEADEGLILITIASERPESPKVDSRPTLGLTPLSVAPTGPSGDMSDIPITVWTEDGRKVYECRVCRDHRGAPLTMQPKGWGSHIHSESHKGAA